VKLNRSDEESKSGCIRSTTFNVDVKREMGTEVGQPCSGRVPERHLLGVSGSTNLTHISVTVEFNASNMS
jgi:hypothetical protein